MLNTGYLGIIKMAVPIMFGVFAQSIVLFVDSSFLSRLGSYPFDASGNAGMIYITMYMVGLGLAEGGQIAIARRAGEGKEVEVGVTWRTVLLLITVLMGLLLLLLHVWIIPSMPAMVSDPVLAGHMKTFLDIRSLGLIFAVLNLSCMCFLAGTGKTGILLLSTLVMTITNICLDYAMIFGNWGFPAMGLEGAAWATVISEMVSIIIQCIYLGGAASFKRYRLFVTGLLPARQMKSLLKVSAPLMVQYFLATAGWTFFFMMIEKRGALPLEVSQVVHKLYFLALIPVVGFNSVTKTYVSHLLGNGDVKLLAVVIKRIFFLTFLFLLLFIHGMWLYPNALFSMVNQHDYLQQYAAGVLAIISGSIMVHGLAGVLINMISGSGATRISLLFEIISILIYLIYAWVTVVYLEWDVVSFWTAEYAYFLPMAILAYFYLATGKWKKKSV